MHGQAETATSLRVHHPTIIKRCCFPFAVWLMIDFSVVTKRSAQLKSGMDKADGGVNERGANGELLPGRSQIAG